MLKGHRASFYHVASDNTPEIVDRRGTKGLIETTSFLCLSNLSGSEHFHILLDGGKMLLVGNFWVFGHGGGAIPENCWSKSIEVDVSCFAGDAFM